MLFNSHEFLFLFLPVVFVLFHGASRLGRAKAAVAILALASVLFYAVWNPPYVLLLVASILFNFAYSRQVMPRWKGNALVLALGVGVNLLCLCAFKYTNFVLENAGALLGQSWHVSGLILPLGISFFTFQQISYLVDVHRGVTDEHSFVQYALFVSFFPQLVAGPIVHHKEMIPQFARLDKTGPRSADMSAGLALLSIGLFKKVALADTLAPHAQALFDGGGAPLAVDAWLGSLCYTLQIYFDFSGYCDMAIGLGRLFHVHIPLNFDSPYRAATITEFWRRWHMTLSRFLKDYLYVPLGGNRRGTPRRYANLMITMLLGGLWHGANWTFVLWGALHGLYLCAHHGLIEPLRKKGLPLPTALLTAGTFVAVLLAWVLFRAPSVGRAMEIYRGMLFANGSGLHLLTRPTPDGWLPFPVDERLVLAGVGLLLVMTLPSASKLVSSDRFMRSPLAAAGCAVLFVVGVLMLTRVSEFLYFQF